LIKTRQRWPPQGSPAAPALQYYYRYYPIITTGRSDDTGHNATADQLILKPVEVVHTITVDRLILIKFANGTSTSFILGVYPDNGGAPDGASPILDTGQIAVGAVGIGEKGEVAPVPATLQLPLGLYWFAYVTDGTLQTRADNSPALRGGTIFQRSAALGAYPANLPDPCPATAVLVDSTPLFFFRVLSTP